MTQQYLSGELSVLLARLQAVATPHSSVRDVERLRQEAETMPVSILTSVLVRALALADRLCWDALAHGDAAAFHCRAAIGADLYDFGICARLLHER